MSPLPALTQIRKWEYPDDPRRISLFRSTDGALILKISNLFTRQSLSQTLSPKNPAFEKKLLETQHPELANSETARPCSAMFVDNGTTLLGKAYGGEKGAVEVKVYRHPTKEFIWTIYDTAANQYETIPGTQAHEKLRDHINTLYALNIQYKPSGRPYRFDLQSKKTFIYRLSDLEVTLFASPTSLQYQTPGSTPRPVQLAPTCTLEEALKAPEEIVPEMQSSKALYFVRNQKVPSRFFSSQTVDQFSWAVTLVASAKQNQFLSAFGGHASLFIEGVANGTYFIKRCHIASAICGKPLMGQPGKASVLIDETPQVEAKLPQWIGQMKGKSPTWVKPRTQIEPMLTAIYDQKRQEEASGQPLIPFNIRGYEDARGYNCMSWAKEQLKRASIELPDACRFSLATYPFAFVDRL